MNALFATAILALISPAKGPVTVNVNAKSGDTITGERTFRVTVNSNNAVTGVEFYVGSDLRDKATHTPYEFTLDSLEEAQGALKVRFKAYTTEGESGETTLSLNVDNQIDKGLDYHIQAGTTALQDGKYDAAITAGRIALKIDNKSNTARIIVARGYLAKGMLAKAEKFAGDAVADDPNNATAANVFSGIKLKQAFTTFSHGEDRKETLGTIRDALKSAVETRRKTVDTAMDKIGAPTDANLIAYADAALAAERYTLAIKVLDAAFQHDHRRTDVGNRLAFAQMRLARYMDASQTIAVIKKEGVPDAYTNALLTVIAAELGNPDLSDAALKDANLANPDDPAVLAAQAYVALKFVRHKVIDKTYMQLNYDDAGGKDRTMRQESNRVMKNALDQLMKGPGGHSEVLFFASALNNKIEEFGRAENFFEQAVLADPLNVDAYVEQGNRSIGETYNGTPTPDENEQRLGTARAYFDAALAARPDSSQALAGLSLVSTLEKKYDEAVRWGEAGAKADPSYTAAAVILGTAYNSASTAKRAQADAIRKQNDAPGTTAETRQANEVKARALEGEASNYARLSRDEVIAASKLDKRLEGMDLTKAQQAFRYFYTGGRIPLLPLPH